MAERESAEEIASRQANLEHRRNENFRDHFERAAICGLWLFSICILLAGATWFYHVVTPDAWHWLSPDGTTRLQNILTGGVVAAVAGGHLKRRMG
ncbi:hypothetical protein MesoLj113a_13020 [Mesorhizobium sp. 113-1-2]|uniref:hypothetical protein n=1 Tax=Mesorhizobium sp. 113-1-2 TaxID=2744515 RepID=UPI0019284E3E|nr:hypothetical protein [Mesorhizobium sp. 113-1-2]BCG70144.1 hypothetical protein MesoLj113a_13020 [Mesorhizobium sp. 113-1-2]